MYKSKLQEFCQRKGWTLPEYSTSRGGPDHVPRFTAVVNVNGQPFETPNECKTSKEAQNLVAQIAYDHFVLQSSPVGQPQPPSSSAAAPIVVPIPPWDKPNATSKEAQNLVAQIAYDHFVSQSSPVGQQQPLSSSASAPIVVPIPPWDKPKAATTASPSNPRGAVLAVESFNVHPVVQLPEPSLPPGLSVPPPPQPPARFFSEKTDMDVKPANKEIMQLNNEDYPQISLVNSGLQPANKGIAQRSCELNVQASSKVDTSPMVFNDKDSKDVLHIYKNQLQQYAQKKGLGLPVYTYEFEGPPHARRFKSSVSFDGKVYEAPGFFSTLKDAEHAAAKIACQSLSVVEIREDKGLYKSLLNGLAQKRGHQYPSYETSTIGPPHKPLFVSTVEIGSDSFQGTEAKTKKQAEMNAAEVAYIALTEPSSLKRAASEDPSSMGHSAADLLKSNVEPTTIVKDETGAENEEGNVNAKRQKTSSENVNDHMTGPIPTHNPSLQEASSPCASAVASVGSTGSPCGKTVVFPRSMNLPIPEGAVVKPYSDEQWVAYSIGNE